MTPIQAFDSPQVAFLMKHEHTLVGATLSVILLEMTKKKKCMWDEGSVAAIASGLLNQFWMINFDEFLYVFRMGLAGRYGKVSFAELSESDLAQWIIKYQETDRLEAEENFRSAGKIAFQETQTAIQDLVPKEKFAQLAHKFHCKDILKRTEKAMPSNANTFDESQFTLFSISKHTWSDEQLETALMNAEKNGFEKTAAAIVFEMKVRAVPSRIKALAEKISKGKTEFNDEELQLQANHPILLERELKKIQQS